LIRIVKNKLATDLMLATVQLHYTRFFVLFRSVTRVLQTPIFAHLRQVPGGCFRSK